MSADDEFALYHGPANPTPGSLTFVGTFLGWTTANNYTFAANVGDYLYVIAQDLRGVRWGLGGYVSVNSGPFVPITIGQGWEAVRVGNNGGTLLSLPNQATVESLITTANTNSTWAPAVSGTATPGVGLPNFYGSLPAQQSIWQNNPNGVQQDYDIILFRYQIVPEPVSMMVLGAGLAGLIGLRRRTK